MIRRRSVWSLSSDVCPSDASGGAKGGVLCGGTPPRAKEMAMALRNERVLLVLSSVGLEDSVLVIFDW